MPKITVVKRFVVHAPGVCIAKHFTAVNIIVAL
jgi:hypothetical protein